MSYARVPAEPPIGGTFAVSTLVMTRERENERPRRLTALVFLEIFRSSYYLSILFARWLSHLPTELVKAHFNFSDATMQALSKQDAKVVGA